MSRTPEKVSVLRFLWSYSKKHLGMLILMLCLQILSTAGALAQPFFYKNAIDAIANGNPGDPVVVRYAMTMLAIGIAVAVAFLVLDQLSHLVLAWVESRIMRSVWTDVFSKVQQLSTSFHVNEFAGATSRKIGRGVDTIEGVLDRIWMNFFPAIILIIGLLSVLWFYAPLIGVAMLIGIILFTVLSVSLNLYLAKFYTWTDEQDTRVSANMVDSIAANSLVKSFSSERHEDARHDRGVAEWQKRQWTSWNISTWFLLIQFIFLLMLELVVILLAVYLWSTGRFTVGGFIIVIFYVMQLWNRLLDIGRNTREFLKARSHCEEMIQLAERPLLVHDTVDAESLLVNKGEVRFENVRFQYERATKPIFSGLSVTIRPGEKVALVGHSGGGKSSFVKLLMRLYDVNDGAVTIDGQNVKYFTQQSLRSSIGLVPQDPILFHRTIAENIAYGKPDATMEEIERAAKLSHAYEFISTLPQKYDTLVGERGIKLSGGERQRVAIARAILADKPILVLDEATSSLDSLSEQYIQEALGTLMDGRTSIVIAHRLSTIKKADRILVIEHGQIIEEGSHTELLTKENGIYRQLFELQAGGFIGE
ncbi:MAG TPA: ABC transporter ATP-binding protein [Candidatus Peribacteraceae bacterium]|nr:ABC transporter ATP-binding protein [Candidatus Peribacteraceae bacterium]